MSLSIARNVLRHWIAPQVATVVAGLSLDSPEDYARLPRPVDGNGRADYPFAWINFADNPQPVQRELNGAAWETVSPVVEVAFRYGNRMGDDIDAAGAKILSDLHAAIMYPVRHDPAALPAGVMDTEIELREVERTPAQNIGVARLQYAVLTQRSQFDLTAVEAA